MFLCKIALYVHFNFGGCVQIGEWPKVQILSSLLWLDDFPNIKKSPISV